MPSFVAPAASTIASPAPSLMATASSVHWGPRSFLFAAFVLQPERQRLTQEGRSVRIGGRALDLLTALVEHPGEVVSKEALMARAWPQIFVDQANLKVNMVALRRALGDQVAAPRLIATVVGRGYRFIAPVQCFGPSVVSLAAL